MDLPSISQFPAPPSRNDPQNFSARADPFFDAFPTFVEQFNYAMQALPAIVTATNYNSISTSSVAVATGSKDFVVEADKLFQVGMFVIAAAAAAPSNYIAGQVTAYNSSTGVLTISVTTVGGAGTFASWKIAPTVAGNIGALAPLAFTGNGGDLNDNSVPLSKLPNMAPGRLLARYQVGNGPVQLVTLGAGLTLDPDTGVLSVSGGTATLADGDYGDIIVGYGGTAMAIDAKAVTYAKFQDVGANKLLGRTTSAGTVQEIDCTAPARTLLAQTTQALMRATGLGLGNGATFDEATAADFWAAVADKAVSTDTVWSAAAYIALAQAATIALDFATGFNFTTTMTGNRTLGSPSNAKNGQSGCIEIKQDATGGRTLAFGANWKFAGGTAPTLTTTANARDLLYYQVISSSVIAVIGVLKDVK